MISPTTTSNHVITDGLPGERREFSIAVNGKSFRILIDGLYENKPGAVVRELMSNGYDSHAAAGKADVPLKITAPTNLDPTFRVRDYGVSMDHEMVMDLYSTMFASTKEDTNEEVGMFGLGSKSPFAYTDTFNVQTFLNGEKRTYVAHIADDGIPNITCLPFIEEQGDEPQGVEVSIPVKPHDIGVFNKEITKMILGAETAPIVDGLSAKVPVPVAEGDGWRVFEDTYNLGEIAIRQGCVIYPVRRYANYIAYDYTLVVDVPIGTVEVTASRESLSMTPETQAAVNDAVTCAEKGVQEYVQVVTDSFPNRLAAFHGRESFAWTNLSVGLAQVKLGCDKPNQLVPAQTVRVMASPRKMNTVSQFSNLAKIAVVVDDGQPLPRRQLRLGAFYGQGGKSIIVTGRAELPRLQRLLGLTKDQVISIHALPDVQVNRSTVAGQGGGGPKFDQGDLYVEKVGRKLISMTVGGQYYERIEEFLFDYRGLLETIGIDPDKVVTLTAKQAENFGLDETNSLVHVMEAKAKRYLADNYLIERVEEYYKKQALATACNEYTLRSMLVSKYGASQYSDTTIAVSRKIAAELVAEHMPVTTWSPSGMQTRIASVAGSDFRFDLTEYDWDTKVSKVVEKYEPILTLSMDDLIDYIINNGGK